MRLRFTKAALSDLPHPDKGRVAYTDDDVRHLKLFVTPTLKAFYYERRILGRLKVVKLGDFPHDMTIAQARDRARYMSVEYTAGRDPMRQRQDKRHELTLTELMDDYLDGYAKLQTKTWREEQSRFKRHIQPTLGSIRISELTTADVARMHSKLGSKHQREANRCRSLIKRLYNHAERMELAVGRDPTKNVKPFKELSRDRYLDGEELKRFFDALDNAPISDDMRDFFALLLWTGQRRGNVQAMHWSHVTLADKTWSIPGVDSKNDQPLTVYLCDPAVEILTKRQQSKRGGYVFPSRKGSKSPHMTEPKKSWSQVTRLMGSPDLRMHDLRRTFGSWQAACGFSLHVIGKSLGHKDIAATAIYARLGLDPVRRAVDTAAAAMLAVKG